MNKNVLFMLLSAIFLVAGCKTTEPSEVRPVSWEQQQAYAAKVKDPRYVGYSIYQTPAGIEYRGGCRLHPNQAKILPMKADDPLRPVVMLAGKFGVESPVLLDFTATSGWLEFDLALSLRATPVGEARARLVKVPGEEIPACLSVVPTMRLGQIFIENPLVYVRMANGPLGSSARGMVEPEPKGVVGWDVLKKFEQIHLDYAGQRVALSTTQAEYEPNPALLVAAIPLVPRAGACAVSGTVDGKTSLILIDPAGDFEVATDSAQPVKLIQLASGFRVAEPVVSVSPGGTRVGARVLQNFKVTVCPQANMIYFETPEVRQD